MNMNLEHVYNLGHIISGLHTTSRIGGSFYIIHKPIDFSIDFSYRLKTDLGHMVSDLKQVRVSNGNLVPSPSTENHLLSLSELADRISTFGKFANKHFLPYFANVH